MKPLDDNSRARAAKAWVGRWIKDGFENRLGLVRETVTEEGQLYLKAEFIGNDSPRLISLDPRPDGECLTPEMPKARYRPASDDDLENLRKRVKEG